MTRNKSTVSQVEQSSVTGTGGELHQRPASGGALMTTNQGVVIADDQNSLKSAPRGPTLLEDFILRDQRQSYCDKHQQNRPSGDV